MKIFELLEELREVVDTAGGVPLTGKIMVDPNVVLQIVKEIDAALPDEVHQAQWVNKQKENILSDAKKQYEEVVSEAERRAEELVSEHQILLEVQRRSAEITRQTEENTKNLKLDTYMYIDKVLLESQMRLDFINKNFFVEMVEHLGTTFEEVNNVLANNRDEIADMLYAVEEGIEEKEKSV